MVCVAHWQAIMSPLNHPPSTWKLFPFGLRHTPTPHNKPPTKTTTTAAPSVATNDFHARRFLWKLETSNNPDPASTNPELTFQWKRCVIRLSWKPAGSNISYPVCDLGWVESVRVKKNLLLKTKNSDYIMMWCELPQEDIGSAFLTSHQLAEAPPQNQEWIAACSVAPGCRPQEKVFYRLPPPTFSGKSVSQSHGLGKWDAPTRQTSCSPKQDAPLGSSPTMTSLAELEYI